nr:MAG TPA: hypothetical protein [Caudoviricetes sp.]
MLIFGAFLALQRVYQALFYSPIYRTIYRAVPSGQLTYTI